MLSFLISMQYLGIAILFVEILYVIYQKTSRLQVLMLVVFIATMINYVGYLGELKATSMEIALQSVKFNYLGKPFIVLGIFIFVLEYFRIQLPRILYRILYAFHALVTICVLTCENNQLFYSSISYTKEGLFPHLVLGHGILYYLHTATIVIYIGIVIYVGVSKLLKAKNNKEKMQILTLISVGVICTACLILFLTGVTLGYDVTMPAYLISTVLLLVAMVRYDLLDPLMIAKETVFDEFADGLLVLDNESKLLYVNSQVVKIYPEITEEDNAKIIEEIEGLYDEQEKLFASEQVYEIDKKTILNEGVTYGQVYIIKDITQNYRYMTELERQTIIAQKANKAKSDFLAKMSHEIRTPINSVVGMTEMILRESQQPKITEYALDAKTSAGTLLSIINDILDTTKIESGKMELYPVEYRNVDLFKMIYNIMHVKADEKNLKFEIRVDKNMPASVIGDDIRIRQVLLNLLSNAVKFTENGSVTLDVSTRSEGDMARIRYTVTDTGIGIQAKDLDRLYSEFSRVDELRNREIEGTGLGMSIVSGLLKLMDSEIEAESEYGKGSTFSFELLQQVVDASPVGTIDFEDAHANMNYVYNSSYVAPSAKILVVDDNKINRKVFRGLLKATQMDITDVESGRECLELVAKEHFDLIFLDHMMPEMDGIETLHAMKAMEDNLCKDTPIIVLTANAVVGAREMYLREGFDEFVAKPFDPSALEALIQRYLNQGASQVSVVDTVQNEGLKEDFIPVIDEIDIELAIKHLDNLEIVRQTMLDFADSIDYEISVLDMLRERITEGESRDEYRIHVHTLKSTSAMIGALLLSKLARLCEVAAIEGDTDKLIALHPILIDELHKHKERLLVLKKEGHGAQNADTQAERPMIDDNELKDALSRLAEAAENLDSDQADELMKELKEKQMPEELIADMDTLGTYLYNLQMDEALELIQKIQARVR